MSDAHNQTMASSITPRPWVSNSVDGMGRYQDVNTWKYVADWLCSYGREIVHMEHQKWDIPHTQHRGIHIVLVLIDSCSAGKSAGGLEGEVVSEKIEEVVEVGRGRDTWGESIEMNSNLNIGKKTLKEEPNGWDYSWDYESATRLHTL